MPPSQSGQFFKQGFGNLGGFVVVSSTVKFLVPIIMNICMFNTSKYTDSQKEQCYIYIINCAITFDGKLKPEDTLKTCFEQGRRELNDVN